MLATVFPSRYRPHKLSALAATLLAAGLLGGCGSSDTSPGTVSATSYAGAVCTSVVSWVRTLQNRAGTLQSQIPASATAPEAKKTLEDFVDESIAQTESVIHALHGAGVPNVKNGKELSTALIQAFEHANAQLKEIQHRLTTMQPSAASDVNVMHEEARHISSSVQALPLDLGTGLAGLSSSELQKAANESEACKNVGARGKS